MPSDETIINLITNGELNQLGNIIGWGIVLIYVVAFLSIWYFAFHFQNKLAQEKEELEKKQKETNKEDEKKDEEKQPLV